MKPLESGLRYYRFGTFVIGIAGTTIAFGFQGGVGLACLALYITSFFPTDE